MSNPVIEAFFLGRAVAEVLGEKLEDAYTNVMSDLGKFDAEQRENLRQFMEEVEVRAKTAAAASRNEATYNTTTPSNSYSTADSPEDLQEMLDRLRAEIASLRAELKKYPNQDS